MTTGSDEPEPDEGRILAPEELDISDDEHVTELSEGRYVVSPDVRTDDTESASQPDPQPQPDPDPVEEEPVELNQAVVHEWLGENLAGSNSRYGFDMTAKFDGEVDQQRMASNDIITVFESLMLWYARQIDGSTPVEDVMGILLTESNVPVRYPAESIEALVRSTNLTPEDSIADLIEAVEDEDGIEL
ncbi:MAG: hypothetical protein ABEH35_04790 [Haloarculaceae archaeon]